ncbi:secreted RxLR effector protein 161-like [Humulus lupulus]|uniref:secreted RxLR effector protein 161-like n=1 Tax=Humulus lupulus TaxID=3486 RepID=UPI002B40A86C|nr:secreted RxLR effector protein 161-like [Humulus lupulus]
MKDVPYSNAMGSMMYAMISTRPDIAYGTGLVSRLMSKPSPEHWKVTKWLLRYLKTSSQLKLKYCRDETTSTRIVGYCDSDFTDHLDKRRSISGYVFTLRGNTIIWKSSLQHVVALSCLEAEYVALTEVVKEGIWLKGLASELEIEQGKIIVFCDSQSDIHLSKNSMFHDRTKHVDVSLHFVRDIISKKLIEVEKIDTKIYPADTFTKFVPVRKFQEALE